MAHDWKQHIPEGWSNAQVFMSEPMRECVHCGKVQTRHTSHSWMRVTGYRWMPLVGRCDPMSRDKMLDDKEQP